MPSPFIHRLKTTWPFLLVVLIVSGGAIFFIRDTLAPPASPPASPPCRQGETTYSGPLTPSIAVSPAATSPTPSQIPNPTLTPHPRLGIGISSAAPAQTWAPLLGASWYLDWGIQFGEADQIPEHWQMVRLTAMEDGSLCFYPSLEALAWQARHNHGQSWIIGNEPDVIWQDNLTPAEFALAYGQAFQAIKEVDKTAQVGPGGISQATPLRLKYLDQVIAAYAQENGEDLPADFWTVHGFILREERASWGVEIPPGFPDITQGELYEVEDHDRMDLFEKQIQAFRSWMAANSYRDLPLILTEFGLLMPADYGFPPERTTTFLKESFSWLNSATDPQTGYPADENHLVQRWAWFSLSDPLYPASDLADLNTNQLTRLGEAFRVWRASEP